MIKLIILLITVFNSYAETPLSATKYEVKKYAKFYLKPNKYSLLSICGSFKDSVQSISIIIEKQEYVDIDHARIHIVKSIENFLPFINKTKAVKYFDSFPMTEKQLYFHISFVTSHWVTVKDQKHIGYATLSKEKINYNLCNPGLAPSQEIYSETYAEAYEKVYGTSFSERPWMKEYDKLQ